MPGRRGDPDIGVLILTLDTLQIQPALFRHLAQQGWSLSEPVPLHGGRSNHVWRAGDVVVKLYRRQRANPLFANDPERERAALLTLGGSGIAPRFLGHGRWQGRDWLIYRHVSGTPWRNGAAQVARFLGVLHQQAGFSGLPAGCNGSQELAAQTGAILAECAAPDDLYQVAPRGAVPPTRHLCLIHGDAVPGNLVVRETRLALIDWQCPQRGDPAEDLALFLSPAMQFLYRGAVLSPDEETEFTSAYPVREVVARYHALKPWFHWRMAAYCQWRGDLEARDLEMAALQSMSPSSP
ncbi:phosphotransferase [Epibacterium sp. Ofav1-8]|uniref:phosphotransferase n=1 Tax=Epibacterium sp. Ofav1-8 TaxID=2917735 RepID=UPI001EF50C4D|nr:phosphotransferase [Epibacterium sp. Ofav1-8]